MIFDLDKITVREFFSLNEEEAAGYMELETILKVKDNTYLHYEAPPLGDLTFGQIGNIRKNLSEPNYNNLLECFTIIYGINEVKYLSSDIVSYFYALKWIKQEALKQINNEKKVLKGEPNFEMEMAGAERLAIFGDMATLITLGRSFGLDPEIIEGWKYNKVFTILAYDKIHSEVQKRYHELKYKK